MTDACNSTSSTSQSSKNDIKPEKVAGFDILTDRIEALEKRMEHFLKELPKIIESQFLQLNAVKLQGTNAMRAERNTLNAKKHTNAVQEFILFVFRPE